MNVKELMVKGQFCTMEKHLIHSTAVLRVKGQECKGVNDQGSISTRQRQKLLISEKSQINYSAEGYTLSYQECRRELMRMITASVQIFLWHLSTLSGQVTRSSKPLRLIVSAGLLHPNTLLMSRSTNNYMSHLLPRERQWWWQYCEYDETHFSWKYDKGRQPESHASCWPDPKSLSLGLSNRYASAPHWSCYSTLLSGDIKWRTPAVDWHLLQMCSPHPVTLPRKSLLSDRCD